MLIDNLIQPVSGDLAFSDQGAGPIVNIQVGDGMDLVLLGDRRFPIPDIHVQHLHVRPRVELIDSGSDAATGRAPIGIEVNDTPASLIEIGSEVVLLAWSV